MLIASGLFRNNNIAVDDQVLNCTLSLKFSIHSGPHDINEDEDGKLQRLAVHPPISRGLRRPLSHAVGVAAK